MTKRNIMIPDRRATGFRRAMVTALPLAYARAMSDDATIPALLGGRLRQIRRATAGTQEAFALAADMSQASLSKLEAGEGRWSLIDTVTRAIEANGGDPMDLFRFAEEVAAPEAVQTAQALADLDEADRAVVSALVRRLAGQAPPQAVASPEVLEMASQLDGLSFVDRAYVLDILSGLLARLR